MSGKCLRRAELVHRELVPELGPGHVIPGVPHHSHRGAHGLGDGLGLGGRRRTAGSRRHLGEVDVLRLFFCALDTPDHLDRLLGELTVVEGQGAGPARCAPIQLGRKRAAEEGLELLRVGLDPAARQEGRLEQLDQQREVVRDHALVALGRGPVVALVPTLQLHGQVVRGDHEDALRLEQRPDVVDARGDTGVVPLRARGHVDEDHRGPREALQHACRPGNIVREPGGHTDVLPVGVDELVPRVRHDANVLGIVHRTVPVLNLRRVAGHSLGEVRPTLRSRVHGDHVSSTPRVLRADGVLRRGEPVHLPDRLGDVGLLNGGGRAIALLYGNGRNTRKARLGEPLLTVLRLVPVAEVVVHGLSGPTDALHPRRRAVPEVGVLDLVHEVALRGVGTGPRGQAAVHRHKQPRNLRVACARRGLENGSVLVQRQLGELTWAQPAGELVARRLVADVGKDEGLEAVLVLADHVRHQRGAGRIEDLRQDHRQVTGVIAPGPPTNPRALGLRDRRLARPLLQDPRVLGEHTRTRRRARPRPQSSPCRRGRRQRRQRRVHRLDPVDRFLQHRGIRRSACRHTSRRSSCGCCG